jgi:hypothetical protein
MLGTMVTSSLKLVTGFALAAVVAWTVYDRDATVWLTAVLVLLCAGLFWFWRLGGPRLRADLLHDPATSTLVFPPESKLQRPLRPPR